MAQEHPARLASQRSMQAVGAKAKDAWLALFADDAVLADQMAGTVDLKEGLPRVRSQLKGVPLPCRMEISEVGFPARQTLPLDVRVAGNIPVAFVG